MPSPVRGWTVPLLSVLILIGAAAAAIELSGPPGPGANDPAVTGDPAGASDGPAAFSTDSAWRHIEAVARAPHPVGTAEHDRVRSHVVRELARLGLTVDTQTTAVNARRGSTLRSVIARNVMARLPGRSSTGAVLLMAHYDAVPLSRGAGDDGLGLAAVLETARALTSAQPLRNDIIFLLTDAEELGLMGARAFAAEHPWMDDVAVVLNFEARGTSGAALMFETGAGSGWAVRSLADDGARPVASSLFPEVYRYLPNDTDFSVFRRRGLPGLNFAVGASAQWYHTPGDRPTHLSRASLRHMGLNALTMAREMGTKDLPKPGQPGATASAGPVYFHVPALGLMVYPRSVAVPLAAVLGAFWLGTAVYARRRGRFSAWSLPVALIAAVVALAAAGAIGLAVPALAAASHAEFGALSGSAIYREWPYALALVAVAVATVYGLFRFLRRWFGVPELALSALLLPTGLALSSAWLAPGASYLLLWPSLLSIAMVLLLVATADPARPGAAALVTLMILAAGVVWLLAPVAHLVTIFLSISAGAVIAGVAGLIGLLLLPTLDALGRPNRVWLPATGLALALGLTGFGVATADPTPERPAPGSLLHVQDLDRDRAVWAVPVSHKNAFTRRFVGGSGDTIGLGRYSIQLGGRYKVGAAQKWAVDPVRAEAVRTQERAGERVVRLRLALDPAVMTVEVYPDQGTDARLLSPTETVLDGGGSAASADDWGVVRTGPSWPLDLVLATPAEADTRLVVIRHYPALPQFPGGPDVSRLNDVMATPRAGGRPILSDRRIVRETISF